jgi:hypothetical protein
MWQYCRDQGTGSQVGSLTSAWLLISGGTFWLSTPATWSSTVLHLLVIPGELNRYPHTYALLKAELPCDHRHGAAGVDHQLHGFVLVLRSEPPTCASHNERPLMRGVHGTGSRPIGTVVKDRTTPLSHRFPCRTRAQQLSHDTTHRRRSPQARPLQLRGFECGRPDRKRQPRVQRRVRSLGSDCCTGVI